MYAILNYSIMKKYIQEDITFIAEGQKALLTATIPKEYAISEVIQTTPDFDIVTITEGISEYKNEWRVTKADAPDNYSTHQGKKIFGKEIIFTSRAGVHPEGRFYIYLFDSPVGAKTSQITTIYLPDGLARDMYKEWHKEELAVYDKNKNIICQGNRDHLYINNEFSSSFVSWCINNFEKRATEKIKSKDTSKIDELFQASIERKKAEIESSIKQIKTQNDDMTKAIIENIRKSSRFSIALEAIISESESASHKIQKEIDKLMQHPDIFEVFIEGQLLIFRTNKLLGKTSVSSDMTRDVYYGRMMGIVDIATGTVSMDNEDFLINNKCHPHHLGSGNMCLGTLKAAIPDLIGKYEICNTVYLLIDFMKTANRSDPAGSVVAYWPYIEDGKLVLPDPNKATQKYFNKNMVEGATWESL